MVRILGFFYHSGGGLAVAIGRIVKVCLLSVPRLGLGRRFSESIAVPVGTLKCTVRRCVMKCPKCWAEKAWLREVQGLKRLALKTLGVVPLRCHHCYHRFHVSWFRTIGHSLDLPMPTAEVRIYPPSAEFTASPQPNAEPSVVASSRERHQHAA